MSNAKFLLDTPTSANQIEITREGEEGINFHISPNQGKLLGWLIADAFASGKEVNTQCTIDLLADEGLIAGRVDLSLNDEAARAWASALNATLPPVFDITSHEQAALLNEAQRAIGYGLGAQQNGVTLDELKAEIEWDADKEVTNSEYDTTDPLAQLTAALGGGRFH